MEIGKKIRELRIARNLTQEALAAELSVTPQAISKWECGTTTPDIQLLPDIAIFFGVTLDELFCLTDDNELDRIQNQIWDSRLLPQAELERAERFLQSRIEAGYRPGRCWCLRAQLHNHQAQQHHELAAEYARQALAVSPTEKDAHSELCEATGVPSPNYSDGRAVWFCNRKTHLDIVARSLNFNFNSAAALVAGVSDTMPVIGGTFVELDFMQDYDVCGGFGSLYSLAQREGMVIDSNASVKWLQNMTCFKGLARYDGKPAIGEAFVLFNYKNTAPKTTATFGVDYANEGLGTLIVTTAAGASGKTTVTVAGNASANKLRYKLAGAPLSVEAGEKLDASWTAMTSGASVAAATGNVITVVEIDASGKAVKLGSATCTAGA